MCYFAFLLCCCCLAFLSISWSDCSCDMSCDIPSSVERAFQERLGVMETELVTLRTSSEELGARRRSGEKKDKENAKLKSIISSQDEQVGTSLSLLSPSFISYPFTHSLSLSLTLHTLSPLLPLPSLSHSPLILPLTLLLLPTLSPSHSSPLAPFPSLPLPFSLIFSTHSHSHPLPPSPRLSVSKQN